MISEGLFERPQSGEKAILVHMDMDHEGDREDLSEFHDLARSAGADVISVVTGSRSSPDSRLFVGTGKADEIRDSVVASEAGLVLFNHSLSPAQERNLERVLQCRVLDRTGLILDIFAQRATSFEGKLQVELAQLKHMSTRLVRGWTHLERQKGGIGLRGPGETQLETDRRLLGHRIKTLQQRLEKVRKQRHQGRRARKRAELPTVSLVGYTNAGKSTLFNRLTESAVYAADQLFATLDPTLRRIDLPGNQAAILADTVGFVRHLPHDLVAAFRSTLEETTEATLLLHVVDAHSPERDDTITQVETVLEEIGALEVPRIQVMNKIDLMEQGRPRVDRDEHGNVVRVWLSAQTGEGMEMLADVLADRFAEHSVTRKLCLPPSAGRIRALLFEEGVVLEEDYSEQGDWLLSVSFQTPAIEQRLQQAGLLAEWYREV